MQRSDQFILTVLYLVTNALAILASNYIVFQKAWKDGHAYPSLFLVLLLSTLVAFGLTRQTKIRPYFQMHQIFFKVLEFEFILIFLSLIYWFSINSVNYTKTGIILFFTFSFLFTFLTVKLWINFERKSKKVGDAIPITLINNGKNPIKFKKALAANPWLNFDFIPFQENLEQLEAFIQSNKIKHVFVDIDAVDFERDMEKQFNYIEQNYLTHFSVFSRFFRNNFANADTLQIDDILTRQMFKYPLHRFLNSFVKRVFDILFAFLVIMLVLSWLTPLIGLLIVLECGWPIFYTQQRMGYKGEKFDMIKFRSMRKSKLNDKVATQKNDRRITRIGKFIRKTSLDELPQFFNVLLGEMSVVGPRPHMTSENEFYESVVDSYLMRHFVKPGITGLAQTRGHRGLIRTVSDMEDRVASDIEYVRNWSFFLDISIIIRTIVQTLKGDENAI